jgi:hypothetical protein
MPALIQHIDAIARSKGRDALFLEFHPEAHAQWRDYHYQDDPVRTAVLAWLDRHGMAWKPCGPVADPNRMVSWLGQVYLDVPFDESLQEYRTLRDYLEWPGGSMRLEGVRFCVIPLDYAQRNAAHDEPGFWERWAEDI